MLATTLEKGSEMGGVTIIGPDANSAPPADTFLLFQNLRKV